MAHRYLESKSGEKITWLEAIIRATKGLGRPASIEEIGDYMLGHEIKAFPESAKTPLQTIYRELYTHSRDSASWRNNEHFFYSTERGIWGLSNPDVWRKHRTVKECDPMVLRSMGSIRSFKTEEMKECCERLREKANEWELLFGEIMLLLAEEDFHRLTESYFRFVWVCAGFLKPLVNLYIWEISDEMAAEVLQDVSAHKSTYARKWIHAARRSEYDTRPPEPTYGIRTGTAVHHRQGTYLQFYQSISFPEDYVLPPRAQMNTVFKYYLWLHGDELSESYIVRNLCVTYAKLEPLHEKPFCLIRPENIRECMEGLSTSQKNKITILYRKLDSFAYEKDLIPRRYGVSMHQILAAPPELTDDFTQNEIEELRRHEGEIEVDVTLVFLYTGLYIHELCAMTSADVDNRYIYVPNEQIALYGRDIPIHPFIEKPLRHTLRYLEGRDIRNVRENRRRYGVLQLVRAATEKYCDERHSVMQCRTSFEARLKEAGASDGIISYLLGTVMRDLTEYQYAYIHPKPEKIYQAVTSMR